MYSTPRDPGFLAQHSADTAPWLSALVYQPATRESAHGPIRPIEAHVFYGARRLAASIVAGTITNSFNGYWTRCNYRTASRVLTTPPAKTPDRPSLSDSLLSSDLPVSAVVRRGPSKRQNSTSPAKDGRATQKNKARGARCCCPSERSPSLRRVGLALHIVWVQRHVAIARRGYRRLPVGRHPGRTLARKHLLNVGRLDGLHALTM